jgi:hypothetical protein
MCGRPRRPLPTSWPPSLGCVRSGGLEEEGFPHVLDPLHVRDRDVRIL